MKTNDGAIYIGSDPHAVTGIPSGGLDNIQIFDKALTVDEIAILSLANKDVITDQSRPNSIILFNENLVLAYDFE